jgi:hypothetical protein
LVAAYGALTGCDAFCWFEFSTEQWAPVRSANGYDMPTVQRYPIAYADGAGQFPAAAWMFRQGYIQQGAPVVSECRPLEDLWQRRHPAAAEVSGYDARKEAAGPLAPRLAVDPRAFFVGPVEVKYGVPSGQSQVVDLAPFVDDAARLIRSNTRQHVLDLQSQCFTLDAPAAQGVAAFFKNKREHRLSTVRVKAENDYGVCLVVSLDGAPLATARRILVQAGTSTMPTGWVDSPAPPSDDPKKPNEPGLRRIDAVGKAPWAMEKVRMMVEIQNSSLKKATVLDPNGYATGEVPLTAIEGGVTLTLPEAALYTILE